MTSFPSVIDSALTSLTGVPPPREQRPAWTAVLSHLDPKYGGISNAVPRLGSAIQASGLTNVSLAGFCHSNERFTPPVAEGISIHHLPHSRLAWWQHKAARQDFEHLLRASAGIHIHGLWEHSTSAAAQGARRHVKPYVISAHGMLEPWALANKGAKKRLYSALLERHNLEGAACLHALTQAEAEDYRRFGLQNPIAIIPNGVDAPADAHAAPFIHAHPELAGKRMFLFLGRLHIKKGLHLLCEAFARISAEWPDAHLVLAGPDFENTQASLVILLTKLGILQRVTFTGMLNGELKWSALRAAACFVLPSFSEGLSVSVLEAMAIGVPVIVTEQCHLPEVANCRCGWVIQPEAGQLATSLANSLAAPAAVVNEMRANGRHLVAQRYRWPVIGRQMAELYAWLEGGPLPTGIEIWPRGSK